jgi:PAS domain S-box-containing protein
LHKKTHRGFIIRLIAVILLAAVGLMTVGFLSKNVASDLRLLNSASSDNIQWTLSQTEVEFLVFEMQVDKSARQTVPDLTLLRREFNIFYSRIAIIQQASIYATVRKLPDFSSNLMTLQDFLDRTVDVIDGSDAALILALPGLGGEIAEVRSDVRRLSNSGLNYFAKESDQRRENVSVTLTQMAMVVTVLIIALLMLVLYLDRLNRLNIRRRRETKQASKRMNVVTSTALDAVVVCDVNGIILDFNEAAEQTFGYNAQDAIGSELGALIVPDYYREAHEAGMQRMREHGEKHVVGKGRIKFEAKRASGEVFPVEVAIQSAETNEGEIFVSFLRDISHHVAAEKDLVAARDRALAGEKAKTDFLATMSHEIRTPLNGLLGNLTLLRDTKLTAKQSRYIKNMDTSGKLLMSHISDVLDITKYDAGKLQLRPVAMNLSTLLQDIIDNQSGAASAHNTNLVWGWSGANTDWIYADKERIQHVLMNVIGNAVKFTHGGRISVEAKVVGDPAAIPDIRITVQDTGVGMNESLKEQIFDDFMTGDASYDRDVGGTGLGLGIAQRFVSAMGGTIHVASEEGKGSAFTIQFPITPTLASKKAVRARSSKDSLPKYNILLVEDNEINRAVAHEMLAVNGHAVTEAHNGQIAVELTQRQHFDLILMDISMPVMDGRAATRAIRASDGPSANTPIVALTANAMAEEQKAFMSDGMNNILTKPLLREGLLDMISQHVAQTHTMPQREGGSSAIDPIHMQDLHETLGAAALQSLLDRFGAEVDQTLIYLSHDHPMSDIASHAHKVAGSAATLGATHLREALIDVENAAKRHHVSGVTEAVSELPKVWAVTRSLLKAD